MLHPSEGLGGRSGGLAGGGVSRPPDRLDSGELIGVRVTEEISRQESVVMLSNQKREDGLRSMYASSTVFMCWDTKTTEEERYHVALLMDRCMMGN